MRPSLVTVVIPQSISPGALASAATTSVVSRPHTGVKRGPRPRCTYTVRASLSCGQRVGWVRGRRSSRTGRWVPRRGVMCAQLGDRALFAVAQLRLCMLLQVAGEAMADPADAAALRNVEGSRNRLVVAPPSVATTAPSSATGA